MNLQTINNSLAWELVEEGAALLSSTRRLSRHLVELYGIFQQNQENMVWETPAIMPLSSWLEKCFFSVKDETKPFLLTSEQEETLWQDIIAQAVPEQQFPGSGELSRTAAKAWKIFSGYKLPWTEIASSNDQEIQAFVQWAGVFQNTCADKNLLSGSQLPVFMIRLLKQSLFIPPGDIILAGFYEFDPVQTEFLGELRKRGVNVYVLDHRIPDSNTFKTEFSAFDSEAETAARWALNLILQNPDARIGIVVPDLTRLRPRLVRVFDHVFHPETIYSPAEPEKRAFNVSLGVPLGHYPLARGAVIMLELLSQTRWDLQKLAVMLNSPFIRAGETEFFARASLDREVRRNSQPSRLAREVLDLAGQPGKPYYCPVLTEIIIQARQTMPAPEKEQSPARWAELFSELLKKAGWPGSRKLNSFEHQTFQAFQEELSRLSGLEKVIGSITCAQALDKFKNLLETRIFQPESPEAGVQVLGLFETAGLEFDHLWIMNLNADVFPPPSKPNPLLPVDLQRKHQTPGASPGRELDLATRIMTSLLGSSPEIILSYSSQDQDREILESPFLADIKPVDHQRICPEYSAPVLNPADLKSELQSVSDDYGLPLEDSRLSGGARAFQNQALCPFKAYAAHRLCVRAPEEPVFALSALDRGNLVHKALMRVWQEIGSLEELREMIQEDCLGALVDEAAFLTVTEFQKQGHAFFTPEFMTLEQKRLSFLVLNWLERELERKEFEVESLEKSEYVHIGGIRIKTRMDRLDRLKNGQVIIIDYKTGAGIDKVDSMWMGERITEPQLPVYSYNLGDKTSGVVLAQVNPRAFRFHGIISSDEIASSGNRLKTPDQLSMTAMTDIINQWSEKLEKISQEIKDGLARVDPLEQSGGKTCRYCDFMPLCRIKEHR
ncbi:MAG: PD-(D/E)XK nuclease family protein [Desulfonatronovibrio sp.]